MAATNNTFNINKHEFNISSSTFIIIVSNFELT